ncbi:MAG: cob(I)yrinic acid a,c-diamide adenosyltransferase [Hyphomicrobiales bacterium]|nr:cob(I)yrinic acid a,c-diamide adenosyltransferase [Hyphomicrobiales bacterium]
MVTLNRIYTRTGDDGTTALGDGQRRPKFDLRIEAYGTVDETNAVIGLVRLHLKDDPAADALMARVQNDLFDLGADLCTPPSPATQGRLRMVEAQTKALEAAIDQYNGALAPLKSFVLPGGSAASAYLHQARTVCRRAERLMTALGQTPGESVGAPALTYINRLSDLLFMLARHANGAAGDVLWVPGQNRQTA